MMTVVARMLVVVVSCLSLQVGRADDLVELKSGTQVRGKLISQDDKYVQIEIQSNGKTLLRKYPVNLVTRVTKDATPGGTTGSGSPSRPIRSVSEVRQLIAATGSTPPDWLESTKLSIPDSLDLKWPEPPPQPWNSSKNVGQFIWDRINPNPGQWRNGVKLMHHIMSVQNSDSRIVKRAMIALGNMYHNLFEDYARAAYWWQQAEVGKSGGEPLMSLHLADCYWRLGSKELAMDTLNHLASKPYSTIKLLGDMGETAQALKLADSWAKSGNTVVSCLYAGDVCRVAGRLEDAEKYYRKALAAAENDDRNEGHANRDKGRAEASLAAIQFFTLSPKQVKDGTYTASSLGYEGPIDVQVVVKGGVMTEVKVTKHREKQFYSSIEDTPRNLLARQAFLGIDATTGATITSEAIINATAKALSQGQR